MAARAERREPQRTCVGCRQVRPKSELLRLVLSDGALVIDRAGTIPGRGAYVCAEGGCLARAGGRLAKALRSDMSQGEIRRMTKELETGTG